MDLQPRLLLTDQFQWDTRENGDEKLSYCTRSIELTDWIIPSIENLIYMSSLYPKGLGATCQNGPYRHSPASSNDQRQVFQLLPMFNLNPFDVDDIRLLPEFMLPWPSSSQIFLPEFFLMMACILIYNIVLHWKQHRFNELPYSLQVIKIQL